jgi:hypothetical protein
MNIDAELIKYFGTKNLEDFKMDDSEFKIVNNVIRSLSAERRSLSRDIFNKILYSDINNLENLYFKVMNMYSLISDSNFMLALDYYLIDKEALKTCITNHINTAKEAELLAGLSAKLYAAKIK